MNVNVIASGSSGNAVVVNDVILIDCGVPFKYLEKVKKNLKLVLLTHIHGDHFNKSSVRSLAKDRPMLRWCCCEWMVQPLLDAGVDKRCIDVMDNEIFSYYTGFASIAPVNLVHDVPNCGWRIYHNGNNIFYATDTGTLEGIDAKGYDMYLIEANYKTAELEQRAAEKVARGEFSHEFRTASTHLSYEQALEWLCQNGTDNSRYIFLHQHQNKEKKSEKDVDNHDE